MCVVCPDLDLRWWLLNRKKREENQSGIWLSYKVRNCLSDWIHQFVCFKHLLNNIERSAVHLICCDLSLSPIVWNHRLITFFWLHLLCRFFFINLLTFSNIDYISHTSCCISNLKQHGTNNLYNINRFPFIVTTNDGLLRSIWL